jgi:hypothetical protein
MPPPNGDASELSDFSVCTSWGIKGAVCEQCEAFGASVVLIEDKASGTQLIQELIDYGLHAVTQDNCRTIGTGAKVQLTVV